MKRADVERMIAQAIQRERMQLHGEVAPAIAAALRSHGDRPAGEKGSPSIQFGIVTDVFSDQGYASVQLDGQGDSTPHMILAPVAIGTRVAVVFYPPSGSLVISEVAPTGATGGGTGGGLLPPGGDTGWELVKASPTNFDAIWTPESATPPSLGGLPPGGVPGQVLTKYDYPDFAAYWADDFDPGTSGHLNDWAYYETPFDGSGGNDNLFNSNHILNPLSWALIQQKPGQISLGFSGGNLPSPVALGFPGIYAYRWAFTVSMHPPTAFWSGIAPNTVYGGKYPAGAPSIGSMSTNLQPSGAGYQSVYSCEGMEIIPAVTSFADFPSFVYFQNDFNLQMFCDPSGTPGPFRWRGQVFIQRLA